jgi:dienelactone hydrolase
VRLIVVIILVMAGFARANAAPEKPPYPTAHDKPLDVRESVVARTDASTQYRVEFNGISERIPAFLYVPNRPGPKKPAVLLQYGSGGNKKTNYIVAVGKQFVDHGFVVLTIDIANRGERRPEGPASPFGGTVLQTLGDYSRAVDFLCQRPEVDAKRLCYTGISWGAITGIPFVAHDRRVRAMVSLVGGGNFLGLIPGKIDPETENSVKQWDPVHHVQLIAPRSLLLINVTRDQLVPRFLADSLHKAAGDHARKIWLESDHFFNGVDRHAVVEDIIRYVNEQMPADK